MCFFVYHREEKKTASVCATSGSSMEVLGALLIDSHHQHTSKNIGREKTKNEEELVLSAGNLSAKIAALRERRHGRGVGGGGGERDEERGTRLKIAFDVCAQLEHMGLRSAQIVYRSADPTVWRQRPYITRLFSSSSRSPWKARMRRWLFSFDSAGWPRSPNSASVLQNEYFHVLLLFLDNFGCHFRLIGAVY